MLAAVLKENQNQLIVEKLTKPVPKAYEVCVKVKCCGVCHTDLHYIDHGVKTFKPAPIVLGHEVSGIVDEVGECVQNVSFGERVIVPSVMCCGECFYCKTGKENLCQDFIMPGNHIDGGYAEYMVVPAKNLIPLPDFLSFEEGALISDAVTTAYHAVYNRAQVNSGDVAVVIGCGGVGMSVLQMLKSLNAYVIAIDINDDKLQYAHNFGADVTINPCHYSSLKEIKDFLPFQTKHFFDVVGSNESYDMACRLLRPASQLVIVGYNKNKPPINLAKMMFHELQMIGSLGCPVSDYPKVLELVKKAKIDVKGMITKQFQLSQINDALEMLRNSESLRSIIVFNS